MWDKALLDAGFRKGEFAFKEIRHVANTRLNDAGITADKRRAMTEPLQATVRLHWKGPLARMFLD